MKSIRLILLFLLGTGCIACSPDSSDGDQNQGVPEPQFTGSWKLHSYSYFGSRTDIDGEAVTQTTFTGVGYEIDMNLTFNENPNNYTNVGTYLVDHIVTTESGNEILYYGYFDKNDSGTWNRVNNNISMTLEDQVNSGDITELTDNTLEMIIGSNTSTTNYEGVQTNIIRTDIYYYTRN